MALFGKKPNELKPKETVSPVEIKPALPPERPVEVLQTSEPKAETFAETAETAPVSEAAPAVLPPEPYAPPAPPAPQDKDAMTQQIEEIMEEDLTDLFLKMTPEQQAKFKLEGEVTAGKIRQLVASAKVKTKKILLLIVDWLRLIPGVNKFFLEQEAKIKTDKILLEVEDQKRQGLL